MRRALTALVLGLASLAAADAAERIERIEPAHWWAGMKNPRLQLLVHGEGIAALEPAIADPHVALRSVIRTANPNYLFIDLLIAPFSSTRQLRDRVPTERPHSFHTGLPPAGARARFRGSRGFGPADALYLAMPDRFANGDPSNDSLPALDGES